MPFAACLSSAWGAVFGGRATGPVRQNSPVIYTRPGLIAYRSVVCCSLNFCLLLVSWQGF